VAPALQAAVWACMLMSVMLVVEATYNCAVSIGVKLLGWKPEHRFKWEPLAGDGDEEKGDAAAAYPMVMVQIPMYNELEPCRCTSCRLEQRASSTGQKRG